MKAKAIALGVSQVVLSFALTAQNFPFPQSLLYPYGISPAGRSSAAVQAAYDKWKQEHVRSNGQLSRVLADNGFDTVSEGIGYGMLLAVNMNDQTLFDSLFRYHNQYLDDDGLMKWKIDGNGVAIGQDSATDADQDVAFALVQAHRQWGGTAESDYLDRARQLIEKIYALDRYSGTFIIKPGDKWPDSWDVVNPSYLAPAYYRVFSQVDPGHDWLSVLNKSYEILDAAAHDSTGLVPDWCTKAGVPDPNRGDKYFYDATRTPWRVALDFLWFGEARAQSFAAKISAFASSIGATQIYDGYCLDGTRSINGCPGDLNHNNAFIGPFGVGLMAAGSTFQQACDEFYQENVAVPPFSPDTYLNRSLKALTLLVQTGNFFNPYLLALTVTKAGGGLGTVISDIGGIDCGAQCSASYRSNQTVVLTAQPASGSTFSGWTGACNGTEICTVRMDKNRSVTASFSSTVSLPVSPSWLRTTAVSSSQINLQWDDNSSNESGFKIERKEGCCGPWTLIATVGANTTTYPSTGLKCATTYAYRVWAFNSAGDSGKTNEAGATTSSCTLPSVPACPTWLRVTTASASQLNLQWDDNSNNESGFKIERKQGCCGPWTLIATVGANVTTYQSGGLACGTTYAYRVWAYNSAGDSCKTNEANATTSNCP